MKRFITILLIVLALAGGMYGFFRYRQTKRSAAASAFQTIQAKNGELTATIGATGQVRSKQTAALSWNTSGIVKDIFFHIGDVIKEGDILADLIQTSLPQPVILAQADLETAQRALDDLYTNAETARVQSLQAIANYARAVKEAQYQLDNFTVPAEQSELLPMQAFDMMNERLDQARLHFEPYKFYPSGDTTRKTLKEKLDAAQADFNIAVKRLDYTYALEIAQANLEKARQDYERWKDGPRPEEISAANARINAARAALSQAWIEAPFDGTITYVKPQPGDLVTPGSPAFRLDNLDTLLVDLAVSEIDINQIKLGQEAFLTFDAIRLKEYRGVVISVDRVGASNQGVVDFNVTLELTNPDKQVKPGMTAAVNIVVSKLADVLLVPNRAVRFKDGSQVIYVLKENQAVPVSIKLGVSSDTDSQVLSGDIQIGDLIILNPPTSFDSNGPPPFVHGRGS